jgi:uncharacterized membrane protein YhaH (DUF805 family)
MLEAWTSNTATHFNQRDMALLGFILLSALIQYAFTIWLGVKVGNPEENRFGPPRGAVAK